MYKCLNVPLGMFLFFGENIYTCLHAYDLSGDLNSCSVFYLFIEVQVLNITRMTVKGLMVSVCLCVRAHICVYVCLCDDTCMGACELQ